jgi:capsular polysaccharide biosynthesis protein
MLKQINRLLDKLSEFLAHRKGLIPIIGLVLVLVSFVFQFFPGSWPGESDILLHLGVILAIIGFLLAWAL